MNLPGNSKSRSRNRCRKKLTPFHECLHIEASFYGIPFDSPVLVPDP